MKMNFIALCWSAFFLLGGYPMLVPAAFEAVKKWQYKPFLIARNRGAVLVGNLGSRLQKEQDASNAYFKHEDKCRALLGAKQYSDAESGCRMAVELVEKLPATRQNERRSTYALLGHSLLNQKKFSDALIPYHQELTIAQGSLRPAGGWPTQARFWLE